MIDQDTGKPVYEFKGTRMGEKTRTCIGCGVEYMPNTRNQKYCTRKCRIDHSKGGK